MKCKFCNRRRCTKTKNRISNFKSTRSLFGKVELEKELLEYIKCIFNYPSDDINTHCLRENCCGFVNTCIEDLTGINFEYFIFKAGQNKGSILTINSIQDLFRGRIYSLNGLNDKEMALLFVKRVDRQSSNYAHVMFRLQNRIVAGMNHPGDKFGIYFITDLYNRYKEGWRPRGEINDYVFDFDCIKISDVFRTLHVL